VILCLLAWIIADQGFHAYDQGFQDGVKAGFRQGFQQGLQQRPQVWKSALEEDKIH
jgi:flagellar biosynthesis/type III secretory pathway protein FliH